jgi:hypothetical protein
MSAAGRDRANGPAEVRRVRVGVRCLAEAALAEELGFRFWVHVPPEFAMEPVG